MDDLLGVHEHPVGHRVVVADDRVDELVHEGVGVEAELLDAPRARIAARNVGAGHVGVFASARRRSRSAMPVRLRHAADAGRQVQHALALVSAN